MRKGLSRLSDKDIYGNASDEDGDDNVFWICVCSKMLSGKRRGDVQRWQRCGDEGSSCGRLICCGDADDDDDDDDDNDDGDGGGGGGLAVCKFFIS